MNRIEVINPLQYREWDNLVLSMEDYSFFHSRSWAGVLAGAYGYKPRYFLFHENEIPVSVWSIFEIDSFWSGKKGVSLPFSDHCEPLLSKGASFDTIYKGVISSAREMKWKSIEFRGGAKFMSAHPTSAQYNVHMLDLGSSELEMEKKLRSSTRRNIKKAFNEGVDIKIDTSYEALKSFYDLNCITRRHHGLPPQPFSFFKAVFNHVLEDNKGVVVLASFQRKVIAGAIFFHFGNIATYKFGASLLDHLGIRPNNMVMWEAIKWYLQRGYKRMDFGRTECDNKGLNQFKNGWGGTIKKIFYYKYNIARNDFMAGEQKIPMRIKQAFRKTPIPVLRLLGALAYRHMA